MWLLSPSSLGQDGAVCPASACIQLRGARQPFHGYSGGNIWALRAQYTNGEHPERWVTLLACLFPLLPAACFCSLGALGMTVVFSLAIGDGMVTSDAFLNIPKTAQIFLVEPASVRHGGPVAGTGRGQRPSKVHLLARFFIAETSGWFVTLNCADRSASDPRSFFRCSKKCWFCL